jgi:transposase-like protein
MFHQHQDFIDALLASIAALPPRRIAEAEAALATARRRAEAVIEIDAVGAEQRCPGCRSKKRVSWGSSRAGARRWRCKDCGKTWTGRTATPVARLHKPGLFIEVLRNMLDPGEEPLACRKLGQRLGLSKDTVWRWRILIFKHFKALSPVEMSGIIETDETFQRESRKGSREWVRHERDPSMPKPPRKRWYEYPNRKPPGSIARQWLAPILGVVDRTGTASFQHIATNKQPDIEAALIPQVSSDALLLFDRAPQYEAIAKARGISYEILLAGKRSARMPKAYHLNSVNSLHALWKADFRKKWRGPATKYLDGYTRWMVARRGGDGLATFRAMLT